MVLKLIHGWFLEGVTSSSLETKALVRCPGVRYRCEGRKQLEFCGAMSRFVGRSGEGTTFELDQSFE